MISFNRFLFPLNYSIVHVKLEIKYTIVSVHWRYWSQTKSVSVNAEDFLFIPNFGETFETIQRSIFPHNECSSASF